MKRFILVLVTATMFLSCSSDDSSSSSDDNLNQDPNQWTIDYSSITGTWEIRKKGSISANNENLHLEDVTPCGGEYYGKWIIEDLQDEDFQGLPSNYDPSNYLEMKKITSIYYLTNNQGVCYEGSSVGGSSYPYIMRTGRKSITFYSWIPRIDNNGNIDTINVYYVTSEILHKNSNTMILKSSSANVGGGRHSVTYYVKVD